VAGVAAIQGVDNTLQTLATAAVAPLAPAVAVTVGPVDRSDDRLRLNWFLYRITPHPAYRNMEPPRTGWRNAYGCPPLALQLHYLLSSHSGALTQNGEEDQFAHRALGAAMLALHEHRVIGTGDPLLSPFASPLVEPLRITTDDLDLDALTKVWTASSTSFRLSVGYEVSLVTIDSTQEYVAGPPVRTPTVFTVPSMGPRLTAVIPQRISAGLAFQVAAYGLTSDTAFTLARQSTDPVGPETGWPLPVSSAATPPGLVDLQLPPAQANLAPGSRHIDATATVNGLPFGRDSIGVDLVPTVTTPVGTVGRGSSVSLATAHAASDIEVFLNGVALTGAQVTFVSATEVDIAIPATAAAGPGTITLRAGKVAGPDAPVTLA
jgi:hypothetical protein